MLGARKEEEVDGGEEEKGAPLRGRGGVEEREDVVVVGHAAADGRVGHAAVALHHCGEPAEVLGYGQLEHGTRNWPGGAG